MLAIDVCRSNRESSDTIFHPSLVVCMHANANAESVSHRAGTSICLHRNITHSCRDARAQPGAHHNLHSGRCNIAEPGMKELKWFDHWFGELGLGYHNDWLGGSFGENTFRSTQPSPLAGVRVSVS